MDGRPAILAYAMNGEPLPFEHGFPVRLIVPGIYGYASATKWLVDLEVTTFAEKQAYWVPRGYAEQGPHQDVLQDPEPRPARVGSSPARWCIAGSAWDQTVGISKVEVSDRRRSLDRGHAGRRGQHQHVAPVLPTSGRPSRAVHNVRGPRHQHAW